MVKNMLDICSRYLYKLYHFVIKLIPPRTLYCYAPWDDSHHGGILLLLCLYMGPSQLKCNNNVRQFT